MPHGKLQMIKVQISPRPPLPGLYLINAAENATELSNQHKNILLLLAAPVPYPLKDKGSLKSTDGFYDQSK